ncbi:glycoprotein-N-acetylgalactosamine 3-beta-galactosyltransferase 1-like [Mya arenaria]|uniref:glycoprotein-N-acetylgalactosamine 3-beta-galactosyltransferase 1-like n=1 Tax=Mya arenaria TaxID=6604 RepID=UPI0022DF52CA|nr:glycoprotein-N-acetylgalactosamine 3-beta-galactosyltransferase 1-like [Mya arenaria]XP_052762019.1 glycoprotein-N-acetylgalactosamine 3-beta-galactosyltransferase 1-like [Mya arenaria]
MLIIPVKEGRDHLTAKVRYALKYAYEKHRHEFDWFLKCDDDTYVIMENLRHMLASIDHNNPSYMGFHMKVRFIRHSHYVKNGYMSGGGGYVISSRALHDVVRIGFKNGSCLLDGGSEDVEMGKCLQASGVKVLSTLDVSGEETFHASKMYDHLTANPKTFWLKDYAWNNNSMGRMCCSRYSVTYHYVRPDEMYIFHQLLYHTEVLGILRPLVPDKIFNLTPVNPF